ncbi:hypothetical protein DE146DRAFT_756630 [Phaeosphaeria sp. MPI-PUGE-AT-0046c]|nr:hypothetical protein DE146DRAFT_756630 [Phaeosphaeria sp. MPI-PUGE-AT-0046c]
MKAFVSASLALAVGISALPQITPSTPLAPALPLDAFKTKKFTTLLSLDDVLNGNFPKPSEIIGDAKKTVEGLVGDLLKTEKADNGTAESTFSTLAEDGTMSTMATCSNVRVRQEWDSYSDSDRQAFTSAVRCLMQRGPNGQFSNSRSRYEDLVALHQTLTPNVHGNSKFLLWHRYYLWTFEQLLRDECGFDRNLPWWDETRYSGRFAQSSIFSSQWFGAINTRGDCVRDGQFANLAINIGPEDRNELHCLARNNDDSQTINTNSQMVDGCNNFGSYSEMASCAEGGAHAWGHNGIGAVMSDTYASPSDPIFWLHHAFIDRNFRIWQNKDSARVNNVDGTDRAGNRLTLDTTVNVYGIRPDVRIRDILDTTATTLCYKYNY